MPLGVVGCSFSSINFLSKTTNIPLYIHFILIILVYLLFKYDFFIVPQGFRYPIILLNIIASTILILIFNSLIILKMVTVNNVISTITRFTGGIYYIHLIVRDYLSNNLLFFRKRTYLSATIIYFNSTIYFF